MLVRMASDTNIGRELFPTVSDCVGMSLTLPKIYHGLLALHLLLSCWAQLKNVTTSSQNLEECMANVLYIPRANRMSNKSPTEFPEAHLICSFGFGRPIFTTCDYYSNI